MSNNGNVKQSFLHKGCSYQGYDIKIPWFYVTMSSFKEMKSEKFSELDLS